MAKIIDAIDRLLFGATAQERVDMLVELAARRVEAHIVAALEADDDDDAPERAASAPELPASAPEAE